MNDVSQEAPEGTAEAEVNAALSAGYNKINPGEAPPEVKEEENRPDADTAIEQEASDPWDGVPLVVRQTLEGITGKLGTLDALSHDVKTATGRVAAIQSELAAAKAAAKTVNSAPSEAQIESASTSSQKWDALKEDFSDWTEAMDERLAAERAELLKSMPKPEAVDVDGIKREVGASIEDRVNEARQLARIDSKHENWEEDIRAPEFAAWVGLQAPEIQALADSTKAGDAIKMLDMYYDHRKAARDAAQRKEKNQTRLAAAVAPKQAPSGGPSILPDEAGLSVGYKRVKHA